MLPFVANSRRTRTSFKPALKSYPTHNLHHVCFTAGRKAATFGWPLLVHVPVPSCKCLQLLFAASAFFGKLPQVRDVGATDAIQLLVVLSSSFVCTLSV